MEKVVVRFVRHFISGDSYEHPERLDAAQWEGFPELGMRASVSLGPHPTELYEGDGRTCQLEEPILEGHYFVEQWAEGMNLETNNDELAEHVNELSRTSSANTVFIETEVPLDRLSIEDVIATYERLGPYLDLLTAYLGTHWFSSAIHTPRLRGVFLARPSDGQWLRMPRFIEPVGSSAHGGLPTALVNKEVSRIHARVADRGSRPLPEPLRLAVRWYCESQISEDSWRQFVLAFFSLEILMNDYASQFLGAEEVRRGLIPLVDPIVHRLTGNRPRWKKKRCTALEKFGLVASHLSLEDWEKDMEHFYRGKRIRDDLLHGKVMELEDEEGRTRRWDFSNLVTKYCRAYLARR